MSCFDAAEMCGVVLGGLNSESLLKKTNELFFYTDRSNISE